MRTDNEVYAINKIASAYREYATRRFMQVLRHDSMARASLCTQMKQTFGLLYPYNIITLCPALIQLVYTLSVSMVRHMYNILDVCINVAQPTEEDNNLAHCLLMFKGY